MPYTNDMQSLAQIVSPVDAAMQQAQESGNANIQDALKTQILQQQAPALGQEAALKNLFTQAQTGTQNAVGVGQTLANMGKAGTLQSTINAENAGNQVKVSQAQVQQVQQLGQMAGAIGAYMQGVPPPARPAEMQRILQQQGIDPAKLGPLASGDPDMLMQASKAMVQMSPDYMTHMGEQELRNQGSQKVAEIGAEATTNRASIMAQAQVERQQLVNQVRSQQQTFEQAAVAAQKRGDAQAYNMYSQLAIQMKQAQAGIESTLVTGQPLQVPTMAPGGTQPVNAAPAQGPAAGGGANNIEAEMRKRGLLK
jgi:hypothetical protein